MNTKLKFGLVLALWTIGWTLVGWTTLCDNFLGIELTETTPTDGQVWAYSSATGKYALTAGGGGSTPDASVSVKGLTRLSINPVSATAPIAVGQNDPTVNPTPTAANAGNIPVVPAGGGAYTHINPPAGTDTALFSTGDALAPAFRAILATDIDELIALTDLTGVSATTGSGTTVVLATSPTLTTPILTNPTINATGTTSTVLHGNATGAAEFRKVVAADATVTGTGDTFVMQQSPGLAGTISMLTGGGGSATTFVASAAAMTVNVDGSGAFTIASGDSLNTNTIKSTSGTFVNVQETDGLRFIDDAGTSGGGVLAGSSSGSDAVLTFTGTNTAQFVIGSGERLKTDTLMSTGGTTVTIAESGGVEFNTDTFGAPSILVPSANALTANIDGAPGFFVIGNGDGLKSDSLRATNGARIDLVESGGVSLQIDAGTNGSTIIPSANTLDINVDGAAGVLTFATGDRLKFTGQAGDPGTFDAGSISYDTTKGSHKFRSVTESATGWRVLKGTTSRFTVGPSSAAIAAIGSSFTPAQSGTAVYPAGTIFRYTASGRLNFVASEVIDYQVRINSSAGTLIGGLSSATVDPTGSGGTFLPFHTVFLMTLRGASSATTSIFPGGNWLFNAPSGVRYGGMDNGAVATTSDWTSITSIQPFWKFTNSNANNECRVEEDLWEVCIP